MRGTYQIGTRKRAYGSENGTSNWNGPSYFIHPAGSQTRAVFVLVDLFWFFVVFFLSFFFLQLVSFHRLTYAFSSARITFKLSTSMFFVTLMKIGIFKTPASTVFSVEWNIATWPYFVNNSYMRAATRKRQVDLPDICFPSQFAITSFFVVSLQCPIKQKKRGKETGNRN